MGRENAVLGSKVWIGSKLLVIAIKTSGCSSIGKIRYSILFYIVKCNNLSICNLRLFAASHWTIFAVFLQVDGGPFGTVPELLFEKKQLIADIQQLLIASH